MRASRLGSLIAPLFPLAPAVLHAQVSGTVYDSLARAPLAGAEVQIVPADGGAGGAFVATADAEGRYRVDSVPAGRYRVGFFHPRIDSLGIGIAPTTLDLRGDSASVGLYFPSAGAIRRQLCGATGRADSTSLLVGFVRDAATREPRRGATVRLQWTELVIGAAGVRNDRPEIVVRTRGDGWYGVCGVPRTVEGDIGIVAQSGADTSGIVPLRASATGVVRRDLYVGHAIPVGSGSAVARRGDARLHGAVRAAGGESVAGARVQLLGGAGSVTTDASGAFALVGQPAGSQVLDVRAVGYVPVQLAVDVLSTGAPTAVTVALTSVKAYLDTVRVSGRALYDADLAGFERRRRTSATGYFMGRDAITRRTAIQTTDLFIVPGTRLVVDEFGQRQVFVRTSSGLCRPAIYIDGMQVLARPALDDTGPSATDDVDLFTSPDRLEAVEIYTDGQSAPAEFVRTPNPCGSILLWTRPAATKAPRQLTGQK